MLSAAGAGTLIGVTGAAGGTALVVLAAVVGGILVVVLVAGSTGALMRAAGRALGTWRVMTAIVVAAAAAVRVRRDGC